MKNAAFATLFFLLATAVLTWPLGLHMADRVTADGGDTRLNLWVHMWGYNAVKEGRILGFFDSNIFYPAPKTLALSEHELSNQVLFGPAYALTGNPVLSYNVVLLGSFFLSGLAAFALAHRFTGQFGPALIAGLVFAFVPIRFAHLGHLQLLTLFWSPLAFLFLDRYLEKRTWINLVLFSASAAMQTWASFYSGYFLVLILGFYYILFHIGSRTRPVWRDIWGMVIILVLVLPFAYPYLFLKSYFGFERDLGEVQLFSADAGRSFLSPPAMNWLYGDLLSDYRGDPENCERLLFLGFLPLVLSAVAVIRWSRKKPVLILTLAGTFIASIVLALGPVLIWFNTVRFSPLPYRFFYELVPGFSSMRVPTRILLVSILVVALMAALAVTRSNRLKPGYQTVLVVLVLIAVFLEYRNTPLVVSAVPRRSEIPKVYNWLSEQRTDGAVVELPAGNLWQDSLYVYYSAFHRKPLVNGYSGYFPGFYHHFLGELSRPVSLEVVVGLKGAGISTVLLHGPRDKFPGWNAAITNGWAKEVADLEGSRVLKLTACPKAGRLKIKALAMDFASPGISLEAPVVLEAEGGVWRNDLKAGIRPVQIVWKNGDQKVEQQSHLLFPVAISGIRAVSLPMTTPSQAGRYEIEITSGELRHRKLVHISPSRLDMYDGDAIDLDERPVLLSASHREEFLNNCIDGDLSTPWVSWSTQSPDMFLRIDLLSLVQSKGIRLYLGTETTNYPRHLSVSTSLDGVAWDPVDEPSYGVQMTQQKGQDAATAVDNVVSILWRPRAVRFIHLQLSAIQPQYWWSVAEMEVLGTVDKSLPTSADSAGLNPELELEGMETSGGKVVVTVRVRNKGEMVWLRSTPRGVGSVRLAARWIGSGDQATEAQRFWLPRALFPGEETSVTLSIIPPRTAGRNRLRIDLVDEGIAWLPNPLEKDFDWGN